MYICLTALDIKKAFDTVDHNILLSKLANHFHFHPSSIKLMSSYLCSRKQSVKANNTISQPLPVTSGVPQGSILGPILFIMFINDITSTCQCYLYADDCIIEQTGNTPSDAVAHTNQIMPDITKWYQNNLLKINAEKTSVILLSNKTINPVHLRHVRMHGQNATFTSTMKYLGIYLDTSLNWNEHVRLTKSKVMPIVWNFSKIRPLIDEKTANVFYTSIIRPLLEYSAPVTFNMSSTNSKTLEKIQNKCLRIIAKVHPHTRSHLLRKQLDIPSLTNRRTYLFLCEFFKLYKDISPRLNNDILGNNVQTAYILRSITHCNVKVPRMNKSVGQRSLSYLGPTTFNKLPDFIKTSPTYSIFKTRLRKFILV